MTNEKFFEKWVTPTTLITLFGAIVWGIQLNFAVLQHTKEIARIQATQTEVVERLAEQSSNTARLTLILEYLEERVERHKHE